MSDLTLGIEEELHLVDLATGRLAARAPELLAQLPSASFTAELQRSTVEINTSVCTTLEGLRNELLRRRRQLVQVAGEARIGVAAVGIAPINDTMLLTETTRFEQMRQNYKLLVDEQLNLRDPGPCGRRRPRCRRRGRQPDDAVAPDAAGAVVQLAVLARRGLRLRQHAHADLAALAHRRPVRPPDHRRRVRPPARGPGVVRGHRRRQDGVFRRAPVGPPADPRAADLRRLPAGRRRGHDRRAVPRAGGHRAAGRGPQRSPRWTCPARCIAPRSGARPEAASRATSWT